MIIFGSSERLLIERSTGVTNVLVTTFVTPLGGLLGSGREMICLKSTVTNVTVANHRLDKSSKKTSQNRSFRGACLGMDMAGLLSFVVIIG